MKFKKKTKKYIKFIIALLGIAFIFVALSYYSIMSTMKGNKNVIYHPSKTITKVFFYRDDCPDCQRTYPKMYLTKIVYSLEGKKILFVNTHTKNKNNRGMVETYNVKTVPTLISVNSKGHIK
ncbi:MULTISPECIES: thioredoxin family protein [Liquorilactobacillus]|uniref:thioredoxin family protein n=1 Tax=Liquorilactobacillus TaxID=2767888 RepID=UPI001CBA7C33|nr:thioredoxin family protein [Liquorilactobacillus hordei]MBZ2406639.1 hypothetical protein [Liquorilactobacillus hordei]